MTTPTSFFWTVDWFLRSKFPWKDEPIAVCVKKLKAQGIEFLGELQEFSYSELLEWGVGALFAKELQKEKYLRSSRHAGDDDKTLYVLNSLAQPFDHVDDTVEGLSKMLTTELPTRLPVPDELYEKFTSSFWRSKLSPTRECYTRKLQHYIAVVLQGGTRGPSEAVYHSKWDDIVMKPMLEVIQATGINGITIHRNGPCSPRSNCPEGPDMIVLAGSEVAYVQEDKDLLEKELNVVYYTTRRYVVGAKTSGTSISYYALDRYSKHHALVVGPLFATSPETIYRVLQCSFNILRYAITIRKDSQQQSLRERQRQNKKLGGPQLGGVPAAAKKPRVLEFVRRLGRYRLLRKPGRVLLTYGPHKLVEK